MITMAALGVALTGPKQLHAGVPSAGCVTADAPRQGCERRHETNPNTPV